MTEAKSKKSIRGYVSKYLKLPLRTFDEASQEREQLIGLPNEEAKKPDNS